MNSLGERTVDVGELPLRPLQHEQAASLTLSGMIRAAEDGEQGSAFTYQLIMHKNNESFDRQGLRFNGGHVR